MKGKKQQQKNAQKGNKDWEEKEHYKNYLYVGFHVDINFQLIKVKAKELNYSAI